MDAINARIISIIDRLAHASTNDQDALQTVYGLRRVVKDEMPSSLLAFNIGNQSVAKQKQIGKLKQTIVKLRAELQNLQETHSKLESDHTRLQVELYHIDQKKPHRSAQDDYSYNDVMTIIRDKFGKQNGALTLWSDYSASQHALNPESPLVTPSKLQVWRLASAYPNWAVQQLHDMPVQTRVVYKWSPEDIDFLCQLHLDDPHKTDEMLAAECSTRFRCEINTNSIKSKFNILRKTGRIPLVRPAR